MVTVAGVKDMAGNSVVAQTKHFTTGALPAVLAPFVVAEAPFNGQTGVPLNAVVNVELDVPMDTGTVNGSTFAVRDETGGFVFISGTYAVSADSRTVTFVPVAPLAAGHTFRVFLSGTGQQMTDYAGNALANQSYTFTTVFAGDASSLAILRSSPQNGISNAPINSRVSLLFSKPVAAQSVLNVAQNILTRAGIPQPVFVGFLNNNQQVVLTPVNPLASNITYTITVAGIQDVAGNTMTGPVTTSFTTGTEADLIRPGVTLVDPVNGATGVELNARIAVQFSEPMSSVSMVSNPVVVTAAGGAVVSGSIGISSDHTTMTLFPSSPLAASTSYTVSVSGVQDVSGNVALPFSSSFTTGTASVTAKPSVVSTIPANGAVNVAPSSAVVVTFNAPVDPSTVNNSSLPIWLNVFNSPLVAGVYSVNGAVVTFTPNQPLPGNTPVTVRVNTNAVTDVAGNGANFFQGGFTTAATVDTTGPAVVAVTPQDGATGIGLNSSVVLSFSEPLNNSTVNSGTFELLANGVQLQPGVSISSDNLSVVRSGITLPANSVVTVVATRDVTDLAGNHLVDFRSTFTTGGPFDTGHPSVVSQRPGSGSTGVGLNSSIVLYVNEPMNAGTLVGALHVVQNGVVVSGTVQVRDSGETIEFVPSVPWQFNALVEVNLDSTALDVDGATLNNYHGSFGTTVDPNTAATVITGATPSGGLTGVPLNAVISVQTSRALNFGSVNANSFDLRDNTSGQDVTGSFTQSADGTTVSVTPRIALVAGHTYQVLFDIFASARDVNGNAVSGSLNYTFTTGSSAVTTAPQVVQVQPPDGAVNVPVNAQVRVRFSAPVNQLTVTSSSVAVSVGGVVQVPQTIFFSNNNQDVVLALHEPLPDNTQMTVTVAGVQDLAGNAVVAQTTHFTTGALPAVLAPFVVAEAPFNGQTGVPLNAVVNVELDVPMDTGTVNGSTFAVRDETGGFVFISGTYAVSADSRTVTFVPVAPLAAGHTFRVFLSGTGQQMTDYAGNALANQSYTF